MRAIEAKSDRARWRRLRLVEPGERRLGIDEAADQPGAGEAVGPRRMARRPGAPQQALAGAERRLRRGEEQLLHRGVGVEQRPLRAAARLGGIEVERGDRL